MLFSRFLNFGIKRRHITHKMSNFNIDDEIDKCVDKLVDQLKIRLKKMVVRSEKQVLRQYIASQKETAKAAKSSRGRAVQKAPAKKAPKREADYGESSVSDSGSD